MSIGLCKIIPYAPSTAPRTPRSGVFASSQGRGSAPPAVFALCIGRGRTPPLHCHCQERSDAAIRIPAPAGAELPPPLCKGRWQREALTEGLSKRTFRAPARGTFAPGGLFSVSAPLFAAAFALKCKCTSFYRGRNQRQRRRRGDSPFDRTTKLNSRDRVVQAAENHKA